MLILVHIELKSQTSLTYPLLWFLWHCISFIKWILRLDDISKVQLCYFGCTNYLLFHTSPSLSNSRFYMESSQNLHRWFPGLWKHTQGKTTSPENQRLEPQSHEGMRRFHQLRQVPKLPLSAQRMAWELKWRARRAREGKFQEVVDILLGKFLVLRTLLRCVGYVVDVWDFLQISNTIITINLYIHHQCYYHLYQKYHHHFCLIIIIIPYIIHHRISSSAPLNAPFGPRPCCVEVSNVPMMPRKRCIFNNKTCCRRETQSPSAIPGIWGSLRNIQRWVILLMEEIRLTSWYW